MVIYQRIEPEAFKKYTSGEYLYLGLNTPIQYGVMSTRVDPATGDILVTGLREERGVFPVLPNFFMLWLLKGIWNWFSSLLSGVFGVKPENNPLRLDFHLGYAVEEDNYRGYGGGNSVNREINPGNSLAYKNRRINELYDFD